jgi:transposase
MSKYTIEFKRMAVELLNSGKSSTQVGRELGIGHDSARRWADQLNGSATGGLDRPLTEERQEMIRLKKELREITLERDILKKVVRIFSKNDGTNSDL